MGTLPLRRSARLATERSPYIEKRQAVMNEKAKRQLSTSSLE
jgi:hypothetical protein